MIQLMRLELGSPDTSMLPVTIRYEYFSHYLNSKKSTLLSSIPDKYKFIVDFVKKMLQWNPVHRITPEDALVDILSMNDSIDE